MPNSTSRLLEAGLVKEMETPGAGQKKRRKIAPKTAKALVILGHAIEYLGEEFLYAASGDGANLGQLEAIQLLMAKNRDIYMACPEVPTFSQWLRNLLHPHRGRHEESPDLGSGLNHGRV